MKCRQTFREKISTEFGICLLSFRAARLIAMREFKTPDEVRAWLIRPSTQNVKDLGRKTFTELCKAFGMAVPAKASSTLGAQLAKARQRIAELEARIAELQDALKSISENKSIFGADAREIAKESLNFGGSGGKSIYKGDGIGATASMPPETRITVNGKTFCLADIDKEMAE